MEDKFENIPEIYTTGKGLGSVTAKQERALKLYCNYHTTAQIAQNLETSFSTVRDWVYKGRCGLRPFREIRKELEKNMLQEIAGNRLPALKSIMDSSLCIVRDNLEKLKKHPAFVEIGTLGRHYLVLFENQKGEGKKYPDKEDLENFFL